MVWVWCSPGTQNMSTFLPTPSSQEKLHPACEFEEIDCDVDVPYPYVLCQFPDSTTYAVLETTFGVPVLHFHWVREQAATAVRHLE